MARPTFFKRLASRFHRHRWSIVSCAVLSLALTLASIRDFLFGSGFYEYADQQWAPNGLVYPTGYFSPTPLTSTGSLYPLQFTRDFITWPIGVFHFLGLGPLLQEKLFYLYSFSLFVALTYILSALVVRYTLTVLKTSPVFWKQEVARISTTVATFTNMYFLYLNVDGGTVTSSVVALFLGISLLVIVVEPDFLKALAVTVILTSLGFLLDPSNAVTVILAIFTALLLRCAMNRTSFRAFVVMFGEMVLAFCGTFFFLLYLFYPALGAGSLSLDYSSRVYDLSSIQYFALNTSLTNVLRFTGYTWTTITYAPPTILAYSGSYHVLSGQQSPTTILLLPGAVTNLWLVSLFAPVAVAFLSLMVRQLWRITLPFAVIALFCVSLTQWPWFSPSAQVVSTIASLPVVGALAGEALYFPYYFMLGEAVAVIILVGVLLTALVGLSCGGARRRFVGIPGPSPPKLGISVMQTPLRRPISRFVDGSWKKWVAFGVVIILVILPGWQAFDGSYFPSRSWSTYVAGNGVPNAGPFEPVQLPSDVQTAYNFIYDQSGNFNIYWPTGGANEANTQRGAFFFDAADAPKPMATLPALPGLVAVGATGALTAYLQAQDVRFLVLQNTSPVALQSDYGLSSWTALRMFFDQLPELVPVLSYSNLSVYQVGGDWGQTYPVSTTLIYSGESSLYPVAYGVGAGLQSRPSIVPSSPANQTLSIDNLSGSESILSPGFLENYSGVGVIAQPALDIPIGTFATDPAGSYANFSREVGNHSLRLTQSAGTVLMLDNWSLIDWGPSNVSLELGNGSIEWTTQGGPTTVTANFAQSLTSGPGGVVIANPGPLSAVTSLALSYRTSSNFGGSLSAYLVNEPANNSGSSVSALTVLRPSLSESSMEFNAPTVPWTHYFTTRFQTILDSGSVEISQVNYSWNNPSLHFQWNVSGNLVSLGSWSLLNWSSSGSLSYGYSDGNLWWNATEPTTVSLNFGTPLVNGPGGISNPYPGISGVTASMRLRYRTSPGFQGTIGINGYYQPSSSLTAGAIETSGLTLPSSREWRATSYSTALPPSTRNFTIRFQVTAFSGTIELSNVTFSWAYLPVDRSTPFGYFLQVSKNATIAFPTRTLEAYLSLKGPAPPGGILLQSANSGGGFDWYRVPVPVASLQSGDQVAVAVTMTHPLSRSRVGTVYTGPFAVDLVLVSGGRDYRPQETLDNNAVFAFTSSNAFTIKNASVVYMQLYYPLFLVYLIVFYPVLVRIRRRFRSDRPGPPGQSYIGSGDSRKPTGLGSGGVDQKREQSREPRKSTCVGSKYSDDDSAKIIKAGQGHATPPAGCPDKVD